MMWRYILYSRSVWDPGWKFWNSIVKFSILSKYEGREKITFPLILTTTNQYSSISEHFIKCICEVSVAKTREFVHLHFFDDSKNTSDFQFPILCKSECLLWFGFKFYHYYTIHDRWMNRVADENILTKWKNFSAYLLVLKMGQEIYAH